MGRNNPAGFVFFLGPSLLVASMLFGYFAPGVSGGIWPLYSCDNTVPIACPASCGAATQCSACVIGSYPCTAGGSLGTCLFWGEDWSCSNHGCCTGLCVARVEYCGCSTDSGDGC